MKVSRVVTYDTDGVSILVLDQDHSRLERRVNTLVKAVSVISSLSQVIVLSPDHTFSRLSFSLEGHFASDQMDFIGLSWQVLCILILYLCMSSRYALFM